MKHGANLSKHQIPPPCKNPNSQRPIYRVERSDVRSIETAIHVNANSHRDRRPIRTNHKCGGNNIGKRPTKSKICQLIQTRTRVNSHEIYHPVSWTTRFTYRSHVPPFKRTSVLRRTNESRKRTSSSNFRKQKTSWRKKNMPHPRQSIQYQRPPTHLRDHQAPHNLIHTHHNPNSLNIPYRLLNL